MKKKLNQFSQADRERAVRLVFEQRQEHQSMWSTIESIAPMIGCVPQTLHDWVRKHEVEKWSGLFEQVKPISLC